MSTPAEHHRDVAARFHAVADATTDWDGQTPVPEWRARDVVDHLVTWLPHVLTAWAGIPLAAPAGDDPAERWADRAAEVQRILDDPDTAARPIQDGRFAGQPLSQVLDQIYTADIYMHTWDLARAGGIDPGLDPGQAREMLAGMRPIESMLRESGQYGPAVSTDSEDPVEQLMAFVGRRP